MVLRRGRPSWVPTPERATRGPRRAARDERGERSGAMDEHTATALLGPSASVACVRHSLPCRLCRSSMRSVSRPAIARLAVLTAVTVLLAALAACDLGEPKPPVPVQQQAQAVPAPAPPVAAQA